MIVINKMNNPTKEQSMINRIISLNDPSVLNSYIQYVSVDDWNLLNIFLFNSFENLVI